MAEVAIPEPRPIPTPAVEKPRSEVNSASERPQFLVGKLPIYEGKRDKGEVFNNGDEQGFKYAVPFQLRLGGENPALAFTADPNNPERIIMPDSVANAGSEAVVLEQKGDQLSVRIGDKNQEIIGREGSMPSLTDKDFQSRSLVIPVAGSNYSLAVIGFNSDRTVIVEKVKQSKDTKPTRSAEMALSYNAVPGLGSKEAIKVFKDTTKNYPVVVGVDRPAPVAVPKIENVVSSGSTPAPKGETNISRSIPNKSFESPIKEALTTKPVEAPKEEAKLAEPKKTEQAAWRKKIRAAIGGLGLAGLLSIAGDKGPPPSLPQPTPIMTEAGNPTQGDVQLVQQQGEQTVSSEEQSRAQTAIETGLKDQSTWGVFLHHLGRVDVTQLEPTLVEKLPPELVASWDMVREAEAESGKHIESDNPLLLAADYSAVTYLGEGKTEQLYQKYLEDIQNNNKSESNLFVDSTEKADDRFGVKITDQRFAPDSLAMTPMENLVNQTLTA